MKSPITGKEMELHVEKRKLPFRKEEYEIDYVYYRCTDSEEEFTDEKSTDLNLNQLYNQYRERNHVPFPEEISMTREKYGLSQAKMAEVLGIGVNNYRGYEHGDIPNESNSTLLKMVEDPIVFKGIVTMKKEQFKENEYAKILTGIDELIENKNNEIHGLPFALKKESFDYRTPNEYTGYKISSLEKIEHMVLYFIDHCDNLWTTKLNKLLFYGDFLSYKRTGSSISGTAYQAIPMGPVPYRYNNVYDGIVENNLVLANEEYVPGGTMTGWKFSKNNHAQFNSTLFSKMELVALADVAKNFGKKSVKEMIDISHEEEGWKACHENKKMISYKVFGVGLKGI